MKILIITGGSINFDFALDFLKKELFDEVIAVDGGLEIAAALEKELTKAQFLLTHIVGDFDTVKREILEKYEMRNHVKIHAFKPEKDYTDTDIALKLAVRLCKEKEDGKKQTDSEDSLNHRIVLLGATGTRLDHVLANIQMLVIPLEAGILAEIIDANNKIRMIEHRCTVTGGFGKYISLIPVSEVLEGIDLEGFKYPLKNRTVKLGESLCVSNELTAPQGYVRIRKGRALLIQSRD